MDTLLGFIVFFLLYSCNALNTNHMEDVVVKLDTIRPPVSGINFTEDYYPLITNKRVGLIVNQTSVFTDGTHLVDSLVSSGVNIVKIFAPEHGFRGTASAGETIKDGVDDKTGKQIVSLYGKNKKPTVKDMQGIDIVIFDIQDVGVRFYTYISTLEYVMEAAAENSVDMIILDRPNPNGNFIDGPVLEDEFRSFVGMQNIPVVYAMTIGEYGEMLKGENLFNKSGDLNLKVIPCRNYNRDILFELPVAPSPNLPDIRSVLLYPSVGFFEGTDFSEGRGTDYPFQVYGHPEYRNKAFSFHPRGLLHAKSPKWENTKCYGVYLGDLEPEYIFRNNHLNLEYLYDGYLGTDRSATFFKFPEFFDKLAGTKQLRMSIIEEKPVKEIKSQWEGAIKAFKEIRQKYLIYPEGGRIEE